MADDPHNTSDLSDPIAAADSPKEDAETKATREELRHTAISEKNSQSAPEELDNGESAAATTTTAAADKQAKASRARAETPELDMLDARREESLREQVSSPKKKRAHDEVDEQKDSTEPAVTDKPDGDGILSRTDRAEPEKKRPRDKQVDDALKGTKNAEARFSPTGSDVGSPRLVDELAKKENPKLEMDAGSSTVARVAAAKEDNKATATSSSAFASSGFAKLTGSASPFGILGGNPKPSVFGGTSSGSASPFGALGNQPATKTAAPTLNFAKSDTSGSASPFSSLNGPSTTFGSTFGGGFGGTFGGGPKLTSFGKPGEVLKSDKPARPFGAPESDAEDGSDSGSADDNESGAEDEGDEKEQAEEAKAAVVDDKKKPKLQRVEVDSGESGEATILSVRARLYYLDKAAAGWKERGAGMLKVNVPRRCVEFDDKNQPIPASFDASTLEDVDDDDEEQPDGKSSSTSSKVVRLLMRQDSTHRVILNSVLMASTKFQERQTLKSTSVLFLAIEGEDQQPVSIQIKMNATNAQQFLAMMTGIQKEMRGD